MSIEWVERTQWVQWIEWVHRRGLLFVEGFLARHLHVSSQLTGALFPHRHVVSASPFPPDNGKGYSQNLIAHSGVRDGSLQGPW